MSPEPTENQTILNHSNTFNDCFANPMRLAIKCKWSKTGVITPLTNQPNLTT